MGFLSGLVPDWLRGFFAPLAPLVAPLERQSSGGVRKDVICKGGRYEILVDKNGYTTRVKAIGNSTPFRTIEEFYRRNPKRWERTCK